MTEMHDDERAQAGLKEAEQMDTLTQKMIDVMNFIGNDDTDTEIPDFITVSHGSKEPEVKKALKEGADALFKKLRG